MFSHNKAKCPKRATIFSLFLPLIRAPRAQCGDRCECSLCRSALGSALVGVAIAPLEAGVHPQLDPSPASDGAVVLGPARQVRLRRGAERRRRHRQRVLRRERGPPRARLRAAAQPHRRRQQPAVGADTRAYRRSDARPHTTVTRGHIDGQTRGHIDGQTRGQTLRSHTVI